MRTSQKQVVNMEPMVRTMEEIYRVKLLNPKMCSKNVIYFIYSSRNRRIIFSIFWNKELFWFLNGLPFTFFERS
jgi:hypothetical protein